MQFLHVSSTGSIFGNEQGGVNTTTWDEGRPCLEFIDAAGRVDASNAESLEVLPARVTARLKKHTEDQARRRWGSNGTAR